MKVIINRVARLLDDYFKVDEAVFCYERFDGGMSGPVPAALLRPRGFSSGNRLQPRPTECDSGRAVQISGLQKG